MKSRTLLIHLIVALSASSLLGQKPAAPDPALRAKVGHAIDQGLAYLKKEQKPEGIGQAAIIPA